MQQYVLASLQEAKVALDQLLSNTDTLAAISQAGHHLAEALRNRNRVFSCGNGGSMCDAMHFAEELSGRYRLDRGGLPAVAISDPGHISCVANDWGYEYVFSRYLESHATPGDCLVAISTSGGSPNILQAAKTARERNLHVIALTGRPASQLSQLAHLEICTPGGQFADRVQELHLKVIHILIELVERHLFPDNYPPVTESASIEN